VGVILLTFLSGFSVLLALYDLFPGANKHGWMEGCRALTFALARLSCFENEQTEIA